MSDKRKAKKIVDTLREETEKVRRDPSSSNYARAERAIEKAGSRYSSIGLSSFIIACITTTVYVFSFLVAAGQPSQGLTIVGPNDPPTLDETLAMYCCLPSLFANLVGLGLGAYDIYDGNGNWHSYIGAIANGLFIAFFVYIAFL